MLRRTRVSGRMDVGRLGASIARPGIDTRVWVSLAVAMGETFVDQANGVYIDVTLMPTGEQYSARVPAAYAGAGFGLYAPIHAGDELLIAIPSGNAAEGPVVINRLWCAADPPPADAVTAENQADFILVLEQDKNLRIKAQGAGQVFIDTGGGNVNIATAGGNAVVNCGSGKIFLGADNLVTPNDGVVHGSGIDPFTGATYFALQNASQVVHAKRQ